MEVRLSLEEDADDPHGDRRAESTRSLYRWLIADPELRGRTRADAAGQSPPGHMGEALDVIDVVLTHVVSLGSLAVAVAAWRATRPRPPRVRLERDGVVVTLEDDSPETVERILRAWGEDPASGPAPAPPAPAPPDSDPR